MSHRPRLLFVADRFLFPVDTGGKIRTTQMLRGLQGGRFEVTLMSPGSAELAANHSAELGALADEYRWWPANPRGALFALWRLRHLADRVPVPVATDRSTAGRRSIGRELARAPDIVIFDFLHSCILMPERLDVPAVLFTHNVEAEIFRRHAEVESNYLKRRIWQRQYRKMREFERASLQRFDTVIAVSQRDAAAFRRDYAARNVAVIGTGVDLDFFAPRRAPEPLSIVFTGSMDWMANIDAMEFFLGEVWPLITLAEPRATMTVVGRDPPEHLRRRAAARGAAWTFTGWVDDVRPYVARSAVAVIPLRVGGGTRLKVYEAMAMGCPVVSTAIGVEGLAIEAERHYLRADSAQEIARSTLQLLRGPQEAARLAQAARRHVEDQCSHRAIARDLERICLDTLGRDRAAAGEAACATSS